MSQLRVARAAVAVSVIGAFAACKPAAEVAVPVVSGPVVGPIATWAQVPWQGVEPIAATGYPRMRASGDTVYLLIDGVLYRSDDHGTHWSRRSRGNGLVDDIAPLGDMLFGWSSNQDAPLLTSTDDGAHWRGTPVTTYEGDQLITTGAPASPTLLRVGMGVAMMVQPSDRDHLRYYEPSTAKWALSSFRLHEDYVAYAAANNVALGEEVRDITASLGALFACTEGGLFRSDDGAKQWQQIPNPDGSMAPLEYCTFTHFQSPLCLSYGRSQGKRLWCSTDGLAWSRADHGLFDEKPPREEWTDLIGIGTLDGSAQAGSTWFLADREDNSYVTHAPGDPIGGLFTATDPLGLWIRVAPLAGLTVEDVAQTSEAVLVVTSGPPGAQLWRYRIPAVGSVDPHGCNL